MVCNFGMSDKLGPLTFGASETQVFLGRDFHKDREYSEEIAFEIDKEVRQIVDECYHRCKKILETNRDCLESLAVKLLECEVLSAEEVKDLLKETKANRNGSGSKSSDGDSSHEQGEESEANEAEPRLPSEDANSTAEGGESDSGETEPNQTS